MDTPKAKNAQFWSATRRSVAAFSLIGTLAQGQTIIEGFENLSDGSPLANQTTEPMNVFQASAAANISGNIGVSIDTATATNLNRVKITPDSSGTPAGVAGDTYQIRSSFKMTINDTPPSDVNHAIVTIGLSTDPDFASGANGGQANIGLTLQRRGQDADTDAPTGLLYGVSGMGSSAGPQVWRVSGSESQTELGLPSTLPEAGTTATSDLFTMELTIQATGEMDSATPPRPLWNVRGRIFDAAGRLVFENESFDRPITTNLNDPENVEALASFQPGDTLYGVIQTGFEPASTVPSGLILDEGQLSELFVDDVEIRSAVATDNADGDSLNASQELFLGTDDNSIDSDGDGIPDDVELDLDNEDWDPADPTSPGLASLVFCADYTLQGGYTDGMLANQGQARDDARNMREANWTSQSFATVDTSGTGTVFSRGVYNDPDLGNISPFDRNTNGLGVLGSVGGNAEIPPIDQFGEFIGFTVGDIIKFDFDYQFTLPTAVTTPLVDVGFHSNIFRPRTFMRDGMEVTETVFEPAPDQGVTAWFNIGDPSVDGDESVRFFPDTSDVMPFDMQSADDQLFISPADAGLNTDPANLDLSSDNLRITYAARITAVEDDESGEGTHRATSWEVAQFQVQNLITGATFVYDLDTNPQTFDYVANDIFFAQRLAANGIDGFIGSSDGVCFEFGSPNDDTDQDSLTRDLEVLAGSNDFSPDSDGDGITDVEEIANGSDPGDAASPAAPVDTRPAVSAIAFTDADTLEFNIIGAPNTTYRLQSSPNLETAFTDVTPAQMVTTGADGTGNLTVDSTEPRFFYRVSAE